MMDTPICDFVRAYREKAGLRLHMPGHKGIGPLGCEPWDITEIVGADELYRARGIIRRSEENAARLFGAGKTVYSTEGSSLCIRAMICLALLNARQAGRQPLILAGRNAHRALISAAALTGAEIRWVFDEKDQSMLSCSLTPDALESELNALGEPIAGVYVTSPDYLGNMLDIGALQAVCRRHDTPLLVDNAHGAYLKFLTEDRHPMTLGADLCCDSAHKTLPVLTGGAYLHVGKRAPSLFAEQAEEAMALFASTSPSYLTLQSLDACNACLDGEFPLALNRLAARAAGMKEKLKACGFGLTGDEPAKITLMPKALGYTGYELQAVLRARGMECEFADPDFVTLMLSPALTDGELDAAERVLTEIRAKAPIIEGPPPLPRPRRVLSIREAALLPSREVPTEEAAGRVLADAHVGCPPCVPILICGEAVDEAALACFRYYGVETCRVIEAMESH